jgi:hypothetical protein
MWTLARLDTLRLDLDGAREHLLRGAGLAHGLVEPAEQEVGLLPILCQLDPFAAMLERLAQHDLVVGVAEIEAPAVIGPVFALAREILHRAAEADEGALVGALGEQGLAALELGLGLQGPAPLVDRLGLALAVALGDGIGGAGLGGGDRGVGLADAGEGLGGEMADGAAGAVEPIGMGPLREAGVGGADLFVVGAGSNAEDAVVILALHAVGEGGELDAQLLVSAAPGVRAVAFRDVAHRAARGLAIAGAALDAERVDAEQREGEAADRLGRPLEGGDPRRAVDDAQPLDLLGPERQQVEVGLDVAVGDQERIAVGREITIDLLEGIVLTDAVDDQLRGMALDADRGALLDVGDAADREAAIPPGENLQELLQGVTFERVDDGLLVEDLHRDEDLALEALAGPHALDGLVELGLGDEALLDEIVAETFGDEIRANGDGPTAAELDRLLLAAVVDQEDAVEGVELDRAQELGHWQLA